MKRLYTTLAKDVENLSSSQFSSHRELPALAALDTTLAIAMTEIAAINAEYTISDETKEQVVETIYLLAESLRGTLVAYYGIIRMEGDTEDSDDNEVIIHDDIPF